MRTYSFRRETVDFQDRVVLLRDGAETGRWVSVDHLQDLAAEHGEEGALRSATHPWAAAEAGALYCVLEHVGDVQDAMVEALRQALGLWLPRLDDAQEARWRAVATEVMGRHVFGPLSCETQEAIRRDLVATLGADHPYAGDGVLSVRASAAGHLGVVEVWVGGFEIARLEPTGSSHGCDGC